LVTQVSTTKDNDETVFLDRFYENLDVRDLDAAQTLDQGQTFFATDSSSTSIDDIALVIEGAKVAADSDIVCLQLKSNAGCFQGTATDLVANRVITK